MSRSHRHTNIIGNCSGSEKEDKKIANRTFRRKSKITDPDEDQVLPTKVNQVSNNWSFAKDGKQYVDDKNSKDLRK